MRLPILPAHTIAHPPSFQPARPPRSFNDVDFTFVTADFNSLRNQTRGRLVNLRPRDAPGGLLKASENVYDKARVIDLLRQVIAAPTDHLFQ